MMELIASQKYLIWVPCIEIHSLVKYKYITVLLINLVNYACTVFTYTGRNSYLTHLQSSIYYVTIDFLFYAIT